MRDSWSGLLSGARQAAVAAAPAFAFQTMTASPSGGAAREGGSPSAAATCTNATAVNDINSPRKVTRLIDCPVVWVFMVQSSMVDTSPYRVAAVAGCCPFSRTRFMRVVGRKGRKSLARQSSAELSIFSDHSRWRHITEVAVPSACLGVRVAKHRDLGPCPQRDVAEGHDD